MLTESEGGDNWFELTWITHFSARLLAFFEDSIYEIVEQGLALVPHG